MLKVDINCTIASKDNIELYTANDEILRSTVEQMEKDMALSGSRYTFESSSSEDLVAEMAEFIKKHEHTIIWPNLLYRIDISPASDLISQNDYQKISIVLWNRVLKKVISRKLFS